MWNAVKEAVVKPLLRRVGTFLAAALVFGGDWLCQHWNACGLVTASGAELVAAYLVAVALLCFDLAVGWIEQQRIARAAAIKALTNPRKVL